MTFAPQIPLFRPSVDAPPIEKSGAVYTRRWTVDLILDLAGYRPEQDLVGACAVEPSAGEGSFLVAMAERLIESCRRQRRPWSDCAASLLAYEINEASADRARTAVTDAVVRNGVPRAVAHGLVRGWVRVGDYLVDAQRLPPVRFVVGNPPYIRLEDLGDEAMAYYREAYATMRGRADIYVGFFEAALRQLAVGGVCAFICADRWMSNQYGAGLREFITQGFAVESVIEMHEADPFEVDVAAYPAVTVIRRERQSSAVVASMSARAQKSPGASIVAGLEKVRAGEVAALPEGVTAARVDAWTQGSDPWPCTSPERLALLLRLEANFKPLEDDATGTRVSIGVASGCDRVYITKDADLVEPSRLLPLAMVADTLGGSVEWSGHYLVNPWNAEGLVDLARFPRLREYFHKHSGDLKRRNVAQRRPDVWFRTIDRVNMALTKQPKLYFPDMRDEIHPVLDRGETYPHHNLYFLTSEGWDLEVLGGLLLSAIGQFFVEVYGVRMRGGWLRFQAQYLRRIRVPRPEDISAAQADALRTAFRARDAARATGVACAVYGVEGAFPARETRAQKRAKT